MLLYDFSGKEAVALEPQGNIAVWDGMINGSPAHPGIYLYRITDGSHEVKQGKVVLVR